LPRGKTRELRLESLLYGFEHDIANYVSYDLLSSRYRAFIASLQSLVIPIDWIAAKQDPKWHEAKDTYQRIKRIPIRELKGFSAGHT
jgi:hypothetical protein